MPDYGGLPGHKCSMMAQGKIRLFHESLSMPLNSREFIDLALSWHVTCAYYCYDETFLAFMEMSSH
jgi:hypothetical protein